MIAPSIYLVTGVMASGKSTVAESLVRRFDRAAHVRGDAFRTMIVAGRAAITPTPTAEAERQLALRHRLASETALAYREAGFTVILQDVFVGVHLLDAANRLVGGPLHVVALCPSARAVAAREAGRTKTGYRDWDVETLWRQFMDTTPRIGLWLDTSDLDVEETVEAILAQPEATRVSSGDLDRVRQRARGS